MTTNEVTEGKTAARELAARLPGWAVWYGQHTRRFWAMPRTAAPAGARLAEAESAEALEDAVRQMSGAAPRQGAPAQGVPTQGAPAQEASHSGQAPMDPQHRREPVRL